MFEHKGKKYELAFNIGRLKLVENQIKTSVVADIVATNGALSLSSLEAYFGYCLKEAGSNDFVPREKAVEIAEALMEEKGYMAVNNMVVTKLTKDVPFLFRTA